MNGKQLTQRSSNITHTITLQHSAIIVPISTSAECEATSMFVETGTTFDWDYLFGEVFTGHEVLAVVRIPEVDYEDVDAINEIIDAYEDDPETFLEDSYEISKTYH